MRLRSLFVAMGLVLLVQSAYGARDEVLVFRSTEETQLKPTDEASFGDQIRRLQALVSQVSARRTDVRELRLEDYSNPLAAMNQVPLKSNISGIMIMGHGCPTHMEPNSRQYFTGKTMAPILIKVLSDLRSRGLVREVFIYFNGCCLSETEDAFLTVLGDELRPQLKQWGDVRVMLMGHTDLTYTDDLFLGSDDWIVSWLTARRPSFTSKLIGSLAASTILMSPLILRLNQISPAPEVYFGLLVAVAAGYYAVRAAWVYEPDVLPDRFVAGLSNLQPTKRQLRLISLDTDDESKTDRKAFTALALGAFLRAGMEGASYCSDLLSRHRRPDTDSNDL